MERKNSFWFTSLYPIKQKLLTSSPEPMWIVNSDISLHIYKRKRIQTLSSAHLCRKHLQDTARDCIQSAGCVSELGGQKERKEKERKKEENILELDGGDGCTTLWLY